MARHSEGAWYRKSKDTWYATVDGRKVSLGVKGKASRKTAQAEWHRLMAGTKETAMDKKPQKTRDQSSTTVQVLIDSFLANKEGSVKSETHYVYDCLLGTVSAAFGKKSAELMKPAEVLRWLNGQSVSQSTRSDIAGVLSSAYKWAEGEGVITLNPLRTMKRPHGESRGTKVIVSAGDHEKLMKAANPALRCLLTLLYETGTRPSELASLTIKDVDFANGVAILTKHKTAGKTGKTRLVILTPNAITILRKQAEKFSEGALLRNARGGLWTKDGIGLAMRRLSKAAGVKAIAYGYRHTFATDALGNGVPDAQVAALLGHSSTAMLHKHYSHLTSQARVLHEALLKVRK